MEPPSHQSDEGTPATSSLSSPLSFDIIFVEIQDGNPSPFEEYEKYFWKLLDLSGYLAPEYAMCGHLTEKVDVFAFGVVALEILSGGPNSDSSLEQEKVYLLEWAWHLHENNKALDLVDTTLVEFNEAEALRVIGVGLLCTQATPMLRPPISRVLAMLSRDIEVSSVTSKPGYITDWQLNEIPSFVSKDTSGPSTEWTSSSRQNTVEFKNSSYWAFLRVTLSTHSA